MSKRTKGIPSYIDPATIYGWREGKSFDISAVGRIDGFIYPKGQRRYDAVFGLELDRVDVGSKVRDLSARIARNALDTFVHASDVLDSLSETRKMDEPIVVYETIDRTYLLHGALRLSCVSLIRSRDPNAFKLVPAIFFDGSPAEARTAMITFQQELTAKTRPLTLLEQVRAIAYMVSRGISRDEIVRLMRMKKHPWHIDAMLLLSKQSDAELDRKDDVIRQYEAKCDTGHPASRTLDHPYVYFLRQAIEDANEASGRARRKAKPPSSSYIARKGNQASREVKKLCSILAQHENEECQRLFGLARDMAEKLNDLKTIALRVELEAKPASS